MGKKKYEIKLKYHHLLVVLIALLMFSETAFYTEETMWIYRIILFFEIFCGAFIFVTKRASVKGILNSKVILWSSIFFIFISIDAYLRIQYAEFNYERTLVSWFLLIVIFILLYSSARSVCVIETFCRAGEISAIAVCSYIFFNERDLLSSGLRIGDTLSGNVNTVGMNLGWFSLCILFIYINTKKKKHLFLYAITVIFMLLTGSKKVFFCIMLAVIMYLFYDGFKFKKAITVLISMSAGIYLIFNNPFLYEIIGSRTIDFLGNIGFKVETYNYSYSTIAREDLIMTSWSLFLKKPLIGNGYNSVMNASSYHYYSHNNILELLANYGLIGFSLFYFIYLLCAYEIYYRVDKQHKIFLFILILNAIFNDIGVVTYTTNGVMPYVFLILIEVVTKKYKQEKLQATVENRIRL